MEVARKELYQTLWGGEITASLCKKSCAILRSGSFKFRYVVIMYCLHCEQCKLWERSLHVIKKEMVDGIRVNRENSDGFQINEMDLG